VREELAVELFNLATFVPPRGEAPMFPTVGNDRIGVLTIENSELPGVHAVAVPQVAV
jgi:hypothetical protein